jgi:hypothetical protein
MESSLHISWTSTADEGEWLAFSSVRSTQHFQCMRLEISPRILLVKMVVTKKSSTPVRAKTQSTAATINQTWRTATSSIVVLAIF